MSNLNQQESSNVGVDFLGTIGALLNSLRGTGLMALEFIQNAEDAHASQIEFDVTDSALIVKNDSLFVSCSNIRTNEYCLQDGDSEGRVCDWHRFRLIANGLKPEQNPGSIGRFGIGFTSVYQITDYPEVECLGVSLRVEPDKSTGFWKTVTNSPDTKFILSYAKDPNHPVRRKLKSVGVVPESAPDEMLNELIITLSESLIFLKYLKRISILRNGKLKSSFELVLKDSSNRRQIKIEPGNKIKNYFYAVKKESLKLKDLEGKYPTELGSAARPHSTEIAIPVDFDEAYKGIIYASLPTQRRTFTPINVNGSFYPSADRKDIILPQARYSDYLAEWNEAVISSTAVLVSENIHELYLALGYKKFWYVAGEIYKVYENTKIMNSEVHICYQEFWQRFSVRAPSFEIIPVEGFENNPVSITNCRLLVADNNIKQKRKAAVNLGLSIASHEIDKQFKVLEKLGLEELDFKVLVHKLSITPWVSGQSIAPNPTEELINERYTPLYILCNDLIPKDSPSLIDGPLLTKFRSFNIFFTKNSQLKSASSLFYSEHESIENTITGIFPEIEFIQSPANEYSRLKSTCKVLNLENYIEILEKKLENSNFNNMIMDKLPEVLVKLAKSSEITEDLISRITKLKIWPVGDGKFSASQNALIPGNFKDPLGETDIINSALLSPDVINFLRERLRVKELSFDSYIREVLPKKFDRKVNLIDKIKYKDLLTELSSHLNHFPKQYFLSTFSEIFFIPTETGEFNTPHNVVFNNGDYREKLGPEYPFWLNEDYLPDSIAIPPLLEAIGVRRKPSPTQLIALVEEICQEMPTENNRKKVMKYFNFMAEETHAYTNTELKNALMGIKEKRCLPFENNFKDWARPENLLIPGNRELISTQSHVLVLDYCALKNFSNTFFIEQLGVKNEPSLSDVISHIQACVGSKISITGRVFGFLNRLAGRASPDQKSNQAKIESIRHLPFIPIDNDFISPSQLYTDSQKINSPWAYTVPVSLSKYRDLLNSLGVKNSPNAEDIFTILLSMKNKVNSEPNKVASDSIVEAYLQCWDSLNSFSRDNLIDDTLLCKLKSEEVFLNTSKNFVPMNRLVTPDSDWFREKFSDYFSDYIVLHPHEYGDILNTLNFKRLSDHISGVLNEIKGIDVKDNSIQTEVRKRAENIMFALSNIASKTNWLNLWSNLRIIQADKIYITWSISFATEAKNSPIDVEVFVDTDKSILYVSTNTFSKNGKNLWIRIFRYALHQLYPSLTSQGVSGLVATLDSLMKRDPEDGLNYLKEIGGIPSDQSPPIDYTQVKTQEFEIPDDTDSIPPINTDEQTKEPVAPSIEISDQDVGSEVLSKNTEEQELESELEQEPSQETYDPIESNRPRDKSTSQPSKIKSQLDTDKSTSYTGDERKDKPQRGSFNGNSGESGGKEIVQAYIYMTQEPTEKGRNIQASKMDNESLSRDFVIRHETSEGREPTPMPGSNRGYDIKSTDRNGNVRYIEVKSLSGLWGGEGITLSPTQIRFAQDFTKKFWLYVIENIGKQNARLYKLQDPMKYVKGFKLNQAWREIVNYIELKNDINNLDSGSIGEVDVNSRIFHTERGECKLVGWMQNGETVRVILKFDDNQHDEILPLNVTKMRKLKT